MMNSLNAIKQYMLQGLTPKGILQRMNIQNPILGNVISMAQNGDTKGVENFARNICKQRGLDFDSEFEKFKNTLK
jgi:hypothetical protein|nr:MAG TPA: hypothetical protein [Caudoviricetes sp.]